MEIKWNEDAGATMAAMVARSQSALESVSNEFSGHPVEDVSRALKSRWEDANQGASITDPELTAAAQLISQGKRVWLESDGRIMADD